MLKFTNCIFLLIDDIQNQNSIDKDLTDTISDYLNEKKSDLIEYQVDNIPKNENANEEKLEEITRHFDNLQTASENKFKTNTPPPSPAEFNIGKEEIFYNEEGIKKDISKGK